ncbi:hypothetical protein ACFPVV_04550 [Macrococcoides bohemicum]|uniref:Uncharacterized protein n=1 Tax=Macrococcoides bohemicum TaxID=1903056 RepID=A0A328A4L4_9STAP|nr:hypothetical protein [Macrococcus bohemicus]RAK49409.1 hypothetical protein BHX94_06245 [Macrococcus bohemicus]
MQSKTSLWNKSLFKNLSRNIMFLTVINIICTFILVPFSYFMMDVEGTNNISKYIIGSLNTAGIYFFGTMLYAGLCGIFITYFLKGQAASDFIHSLPIKRHRILNTVYVTYFTHVFFNLLINGIITLLCGIKFYGINIEKVLIWMLLSLLIHLFIFSLTVLLSLLINNYLSHIVGTIALLISPVIMGTLIYTTHMVLFKGLSEYPEIFLNDITIPLKFMEYVVTDRYNFIYLVVMFIISIVMIALSYYVYMRRQNERINEPYANQFIHLIIYFIMLLIATLLGGLIFSSLFSETKIVSLIIYIIAFTVAFMLMEMISQKSARITFDKRLYITSFGIVALALMLVIISGYMREQFIPDKKEISSVATTFEDANQMYMNQSLLNDTKVSNQAFIDSVVDAHKQLKNPKKGVYNNDVAVRTIHIQYIMNNGRVVDRNYEVFEKDYDNYIKRVNTEDNMKALITALDLSKHKKDQISITHEVNNDSFTGDSMNNKQKEKLIKVLETSIKERSFNSNLEAGRTKYSITFDYEHVKSNGMVTESGSYDVPISIYDTKLIQFLIDEEIISEPSDVIKDGNVYELPRKTSFEHVRNIESISDIKGAKKIDRKDFKRMVNAQQIDSKGQRIFVIDSLEKSFIFMK